MKRQRNRKAMIVAMTPAVLIPTMRLLNQSHVPDDVTGPIVGIAIGCMILLLISAARDRGREAGENPCRRRCARDG